MKLYGIAAASVSIVIGGVLVLRTPSKSEKAEPAKTSQHVKAVSAPEKVEEPRKPSSLLAAASQELRDVAARPSKPFEFQKELGDYAFLKKKVLLSDADKSEKKDLMQNDRFLRSLESLLKTPTNGDFEMEQQQNFALDLLFEALESDTRSIASEVLQAIVQDPQVENAQLDRKSREKLAGLKAEVLYQWAALEPGKSGEIQSWLPGPVSQRIWQNVLASQHSNLEESAAEARAM